MFQGFKKATPYGGARNLRLTQPPVRRVSVYMVFCTLRKISGHNGAEFDGDVLSDAKPTLLHAFRILTLSAAVL